MTLADRQTISKLQATLTKINDKQPVFFNIVQFRDQLGLVKEHGNIEMFVNGVRRIHTNWILTTKGKMILNAPIF